jgi:hypothetical protein
MTRFLIGEAALKAALLTTGAHTISGRLTLNSHALEPEPIAELELESILVPTSAIKLKLVGTHLQFPTEENLRVFLLDCANEFQEATGFSRSKSRYRASWKIIPTVCRMPERSRLTPWRMITR